MANSKGNKKPCAIEEWRTHDPFQRASASLIRRVNKEILEFNLLKNRNKVKVLLQSKALF